MKCSDNNLITLLIINLGAESATHIKKSLTICRCQGDELNRPNIDNINHVSEDVISSWQEIICHGSQPKEVDTDMDMDYNYYKSNSSGHLNSLTGILEPIIGKMEMSKEHLTKIKSSRLGNNSQAIILCDIIQGRFSLNYFQRVVVEEVLNHTILNEGNQCHYKSDQLLLHVRRDGRVGKSRIVKAIYLGFSFLKRRKKLLIAAPTRAATANIDGATIHEALNIDDRIQNNNVWQKTFGKTVWP